MDEERRFMYDDIRRVADVIIRDCMQHGLDPEKITDGMILGSGLGGFGNAYLNAEKANTPSGPIARGFDDFYQNVGIPYYPYKKGGGVPGHAKKIIVGPLADDSSGRLVIAQSGREHPYEGVSLKRATIWLRAMQVLGVKRLIGSNAAGIVTPDTLVPPGLMLVMGDQDYGTEDNVLRGENDSKFGERFPHNSDRYSADLRRVFKETANELKITLPEGIYFRFSGPFYESAETVYRLRGVLRDIWKEGILQPGEKRFDVDGGRGEVGTVGMSLTYEMDVAQQASQSKEFPAFQEGRACINACTNYSASLGRYGIVAPSNHEEVTKNSKEIEEMFGRLIREVLRAV